MTNQLHVESAIERSLGKAGGVGNERFEIRFWLTTEINGKKVESRGATTIVEVANIGDAREFATKRAAYIEMRIGNDELGPKEANAKLPEYIQEVNNLDAEWNNIISKTFDN